jgi:DNA-binding transcriptional MerR regulator
MAAEPRGVSDVDAAPERPRYKMKDLCELTGLPRQAIHFYIGEGLVPPGHKTGRNMAYYGPEHVERILWIRRLQHERFLPLRAIRALLEQQDDAFSPAQRRQLSEVRERMRAALGLTTSAKAVDAAEIMARAGVDRADLDDLALVGLLHVREDSPGEPLIADSDAWVIELWGELRRAGLTRELGYSPRDFQVMLQAMSTMFEHETKLLAERTGHLPPEKLASLVVATLPLLNEILVRYHMSLVRGFFAVVPGQDPLSDKE